jgi:hypothetical protein
MLQRNLPRIVDFDSPAGPMPEVTTPPRDELDQALEIGLLVGRRASGRDAAIWPARESRSALAAQFCRSVAFD